LKNGGGNTISVRMFGHFSNTDKLKRVLQNKFLTPEE